MSTTFPDKFTIANRINLRMIFLGLTQAELARRTGLTEMFVSRILRAKHDPSARRLHAIARALGTTVDELLSE